MVLADSFTSRDTFLSDYSFLRDKLIKNADKLIQFYQDTRQAKDVEIITENKKRFYNQEFTIVVLGEWSRGKSTFINAILGEKVLPSRVTPTTATINVIHHGDTKKVSIHYRNKKRVETSLENLKQIVTTVNTESNDISEVHIYYPSDIFKNNVTLVDTPGVNDLNEQREAITFNYIPKADAAILILDAHQPLSASEMNFLQDKIQKNNIKKIFFIANKVETMDEQDINTSVSYMERNLRNVVDEPKVYPLSSRAYLKGDKKELFEGFLSALEKFLMEEKGTFLIENFCAKCIHFVDTSHENYLLQLSSLSMSKSEIAAKDKEIKSVFSSINHELKNLDAEISGEKKYFGEQMNCIIDKHLREVKKEISQMIDDTFSFSNLESFMGRVKNSFERNIKSLLEKIQELLNEKVTEINSTIEQFHKKSSGKLTKFRQSFRGINIPKSIEAVSIYKHINTQTLTKFDCTVTLPEPALIDQVVDGAINLFGFLVSCIFKTDFQYRTHFADVPVEQQRSSLHNQLEQALNIRGKEIKKSLQANVSALFENFRASLAERVTFSQRSIQSSLDQALREHSQDYRKIELQRTKIESDIHSLRSIKSQFESVLDYTRR